MFENSSERKTISNENYATKEELPTDKAIELNFVRNKLKTLQDKVLRDVQKRITIMIDEVMQELGQYQQQTNVFHNFVTPQIPYINNSNNKPTTWMNRIKTTNDISKNKILTINGKIDNDLSDNVFDKEELVPKTSFKKYHDLPDKVFAMRESFLTGLLEVDHMKTIYHIFYIIFSVFLLNNISFEYFSKGSVTFGLSIIRKGLENIHKIAGIWFLQHVFVFSIYFALRGWSHVRTKLVNHKVLQRLWSVSCLFIYIATQLIFTYVPTQICLHLNLPFITASVLLLETVRLLMKMHSFVRTITPRILVGKLKAEQETAKQINIPAFNKYLYYLFAPTLLYRDEYPRTSTIRWKFAISRFLEIVIVAFLYSYIYERHIKYHFGNFGVEELNATSMIIKLFGMLMPGNIIFLAGFYMILHSWLNFTAELLRFGDRMFYRDWWTANNYEVYYRKWNVVVHDWLYEYIYKDTYNHIFKGSKCLSSLTVFIISALFHEYILGYALQVVFPVMFCFFGVIGVLVIFVTRYIPKNLGNIFLWFSLIYGNSTMISLYSIEYFTRINCPKEYNSWTDNLLPHVWSCYFK